MVFDDILGKEARFANAFCLITIDCPMQAIAVLIVVPILFMA